MCGAPSQRTHRPVPQLSASLRPHRLSFSQFPKTQGRVETNRPRLSDSRTYGGVEAIVFWALSENLTKRPLLRNFLHPLNCEEPTLVTAIRLAMDERHRSGWFERDAEGAG